MTERKTLCVAGASGVAGSHIVQAALARGYRVIGTMRNAADPAKAPYLHALPGGADALKLFSADMNEEGAFDEAVAGADGLFIATLIPVYAGPSGTPAVQMDDAQGYAEIIMPTVDGCMNILRSAARRGVKTVVVCSSTSSTNPVPPVPVKNEVDHWSDPAQQCSQKKYTSATKAVMEKAAMAFAEEHGIRLSVLLPTGMYGPVLLPEHMERNPQVWLKRLIETGTPRHERMPNDSTSMIHLEDLGALFLAAYENPDASGRYFGVYDSWPWMDLYRELERLVPGMTMPAPFDGAPNPPTRFDFTRRDSLGVPVRDIPTLLAETISWLKTDPFKASA